MVLNKKKYIYLSNRIYRKVKSIGLIKNTVVNESIPNFFYPFHKNSVVSYPIADFQSRIFAIQIDLSSIDSTNISALIESMFQMECLHRIRIITHIIENISRIYPSCPSWIFSEMTEIFLPFSAL